MKAIIIEEAGSPEVLQFRDLPNPVPSDNEVIIEQSFAGVNYGDVIRRKRGLFQLNSAGFYIPGFEGVGNIIGRGKAVKDLKIGERVIYLNELGGGYAQHVSVNEKNVLAIPDIIPDHVAAALPCVGATAWHLLKASKLKRGQWVLIHGATGGVGLILTQMALLKGARVIAVVGSENKKAIIDQYNGISIVGRFAGELSDQVMNLTDGYGIDVIFDCVGQDVLETNMKCIHSSGQILYYGSVSGHSIFPGVQILMNSLQIQGFNIFNTLKNKVAWQAGLKNLFTLISTGKINVRISEVFPMSEAFKAHQLLESRKSTGKLLLDLKKC